MFSASARESLLSFITEVIGAFGDEYQRSRCEAGLRLILTINSQRGFPCCVGSWDCEHWKWKIAPYYGQGNLKIEKRTIQLFPKHALNARVPHLTNCHLHPSEGRAQVL